VKTRSKTSRRTNKGSPPYEYAGGGCSWERAEWYQGRENAAATGFSITGADAAIDAEGTTSTSCSGCRSVARCGCGEATGGKDECP
jgi:hypothetical protein